MNAVTGDKSHVNLDRMISKMLAKLHPGFRAIIENYCAFRVRTGMTIQELLEEHPVKAIIEINLYIAGFDPEHRRRFDPGHVSSDIALFVGEALRIFYAALAVARLRFAGDPFNTLIKHGAIE